MTNSTPPRVEILNEAADIIVGQRQKDYGTPQENFGRMAAYANIHFAKNLEQNIPISPRQIAEFMVLLKLARTINSPTRDSYVDIGGYGGIAGELAEDEQTAEKAKLESQLLSIANDFDPTKVTTRSVSLSITANDAESSFTIPNATVSIDPEAKG